MGNFAGGARLYVRLSPVVEIHPNAGGTTEFISNQISGGAWSGSPSRCHVPRP